ncbi:MAG: hypothetical protein KO173_00065 [Methanoregulaceae archaeon]|nr:hypothetical protein [Methanoregulaceae archaeon]
MSITVDIPLPDRDPGVPVSQSSFTTKSYTTCPWGVSYRSLTGIQCRVPGLSIVIYQDVIHDVPMGGVIPLPDRDPVSHLGPLIVLYHDVVHGVPPDRDPVSRPGPLIVLYHDVVHGVPWGEAYRSLIGIQCRVPVL